jgi:hypothetical protein
MGAERDANLHQLVAELEQIRDVLLASLHFPSLFPLGELGWHLDVQYHGLAMNLNNNSLVVILPHSDSATSLMGTHCSIALQDYFFARFPY